MKVGELDSIGKTALTIKMLESRKPPSLRNSGVVNLSWRGSKALSTQATRRARTSLALI